MHRCSLPLTGKRVVHKVVTDLGVFTPEGAAFQIERLAPGVTEEQLGMSDSLISY